MIINRDYKYRVIRVPRHANRRSKCVSIRFMDLDVQAKKRTSILF